MLYGKNLDNWLTNEVPSSQQYKDRVRREEMTQKQPLQQLQGKINQTFSNPQSGPRMQAEQVGGANPYLAQHFSNQRAQLAGNAQGALRAQQDALRRRFAQTGMRGSGAEIAAIQNAANANEQARNEAMLGLGGQEAQANAAWNDGVIARNFQREGQNFQQQLGESPIARLMQQLQAQGALAGMDQGYQQLLNDKLANEINAKLGQGQLDRSGGLFGGGGFLGLGF